MFGVIIMSKDLTILLVEDDPDACSDFAQHIDTLEDISLIAITNSSAKAIQHVTDYLPDVVILDLELHQGSGNGLLFLKELQEMLLVKSPYILVTTNNISEITYEQARSMGADFIMSKHQQEYSPQRVIDFLKIMKDTIQQSNRHKQSERSQILTEDTPGARTTRLEKRMNAEFDLVGISPKAIGRKYLIDAIQLIMSEQRHNVCSEIGKKFNKSDSSVERAMQSAINKAWRTTNIEDLSNYYTAKISSDKGVPTLTEFICFYAQKLKDYAPIKINGIL